MPRTRRGGRGVTKTYLRVAHDRIMLVLYFKAGTIILGQGRHGESVRGSMSVKDLKQVAATIFNINHNLTYGFSPTCKSWQSTAGRGNLADEGPEALQGSARRQARPRRWSPCGVWGASPRAFSSRTLKIAARLRNAPVTCARCGSMFIPTQRDADTE
jgi:hypothetical protein